MSDRRAHAVFFGFDFQVNAAIMLMLENIKELKYLRLEGNYEDIELIFKNGGKKDAQIQLDKKNLIWPIIVLETDITRCDENFINQFDAGVYDEVVRLYGQTIDSCCERIDFFTRVLYDYTKFQCTKQAADKRIEFVNSSWEAYKAEFTVDGINAETLEALTKIVIFNVVHRRIIIDKIKQGVNL